MAGLIVVAAIIVATVIFVALLSWGSSLIVASITSAIVLVAMIALLRGLNSGCTGKD